MSGIITAAAISAGSAYYGSQQAKKAGRKMDKARRPYEQFNIETALPYAKDRMKASGEMYGTASNFWNKLATGGTEDYMSLLGPQMKAIGNQAAAQRNATLELGGRGGGSAMAAMQPMLNMNQQFADAMLQMKPAAMGQVAQLAQDQGQLGIAAGAGAQNSGADLLRQQQWQQQQQFEQDQQYGQAIAGALAGIDWGSMFGGGKTLPTSGSIGTAMKASPGVNYGADAFTYKKPPTWSGSGVNTGGSQWWWG